MVRMVLTWSQSSLVLRLKTDEEIGNLFTADFSFENLSRDIKNEYSGHRPNLINPREIVEEIYVDFQKFHFPKEVVR